MNRKLLKENAKKSFKENYWKSVAVALIFMVTACITPSINLSESTPVHNVITISLAIGSLSLALRILVLRPLRASCQNFFLVNSDQKADFDTLKSAFQKNYPNVFITLLLTDVFTALWTCLFIVPGIVKAYSYRMVPYILAENPDMDTMEVIKKSCEMMDGHKFEAFKLDLSFIGWHTLSVLTLGMVGIFWTDPYTCQTNAEFYKVVKLA